jgi:hypothetical protein
MAGKNIDLEFTVASGSSDGILRALANIVNTANGGDQYSGIDYHMSAKSRSQIAKEFRDVANELEKASKTTSNTAGINKETAARERSAQATQKQVAAERELGEATRGVAEQTDAVSKARAKEAADATRMNNLQLQMGNYAKKYGENLSKNVSLQARFNELMAQVKTGNLTPQDAAKAWSQFRLECRAAGVEVETLGQKVSKLFGEGFKTRARTLIGMAALTATRQILSDVKEIDAAMTELRKVTDETAETYNKFMQNSGARAKEIGATMSDVIKSTADFARLGYNIQDASKLADAAIVLKNVGDGISDIDDASEKIISVVKAFPEFEGNAMTVVDKMNEVGKQCCPAA